MMSGIPPVMWFWRQQMGAARARGLSVEQFRVMTVVERDAASSLSDLASAIGSSLPAASRLVGRLVEKGLVSRDESADDRRRCSLVLTDRGRVALRSAQAGARDALAAELSAAVGDAQCARIAEAMRTLDQVFTAARLAQSASRRP